MTLFERLGGVEVLSTASFDRAPLPASSVASVEAVREECVRFGWLGARAAFPADAVSVWTRAAAGGSLGALLLFGPTADAEHPGDLRRQNFAARLSGVKVPHAFPLTSLFVFGKDRSERYLLAWKAADLEVENATPTSPGSGSTAPVYAFRLDETAPPPRVVSCSFEALCKRFALGDALDDNHVAVTDDDPEEEGGEVATMADPKDYARRFTPFPLKGDSMR